jgi:hypothetical protein
MERVLMSNPNAVAGVVAAGGGGQAVLFLSSLFGWTIDPGAAIWISGALAGAVLWVGRVSKEDGLAGVWHRLIHGQPAKT